MGEHLRRFRFRYGVRLTSLFLVSFIFLNYQNCSPGFKPISYESSFTSSGDVLDIQNQALGILTNQCSACHGTIGQGGVQDILDINHLTDSGLIIPGQPGLSPLIRVIENGTMPPTGAMSASDLQILNQWVLALGGAPTGPITPPEPVELSFSFSPSIHPLLFKIRIEKLAYVLNTVSSNALFDGLRSSRDLLGDYDFARSIQPSISWEPTDMNRWLQAMQSICSSTTFRNTYTWPSGTNLFLMRALGREANSADQANIQEITNLANSTNQERFEVFCLTTLSSLEFISK